MVVAPFSGASTSCHPSQAKTDLGDKGLSGLAKNFTLMDMESLDVNDFSRYTTDMIVEKLAECPICYEPYSSERTAINAGCGHTFCHNCINDVVEKAKSDIFTCPTCNQEFDVSKLELNEELVKTMKAVHLMREHAKSLANES